jgi:hypothetical protein
MERVYVDVMNDDEIVFSSLSDMEKAMNELANGKSIIAIYPISPGKKRARVISVSSWNMITDGKLSVSANVQEGEE